MRKQLGILTSLLFLCATALLWVGCSSNSWCCAEKTSACEPCPPVCREPCRPICPEPCRPAFADCEPICDEPCRPVCDEPCRPICPEPCRPVCQEPCRPVCQEPCRPVCPEPCRPVCPEPCRPVCKPCPEPPQEPLCKPAIRCRHPNANQLDCRDGITVTARNPKLCMLGDQYPLDFDVKACDDVCDVIVTTHLPEGVSLVKSQPEPKVDGRRLTWFFGSMNRGECRPARVWLKCECEGELCACFCATAIPVRFCSLLCAKPVLVCEKCGPEQVCPGDAVCYTVTVTNRGSCTAEGVVLTDNIPDGLEHCSGQKTLVFQLGCLEPCQTKRVNIPLKAVKRGKFCNTAVVTACNADSTSCQACTCVCCCAIECSKIGPKEQAIGKNADYQITVINTGDLPLTDVVVTDSAPSATSIVAANGAQICGNQAVWRVRELKAGEKGTFNITLTTCTPGCFTNHVNVTNCQGCPTSCEFTTRWRGRPALNVCFEATENPICIGETTSYNIDVVNQGSEPDSNVVVVVRFPKELTPVGSTGDAQGTVSGQTVTFGPIRSLNPRQTLNFRVDARAKESGDARVTVEVSSDAIKTPITQQESTIVN